jgi:hypothetical protein
MDAKLSLHLEIATDEEEKLDVYTNNETQLQEAFRSWFKPAITWRVWISRLRSITPTADGGGNSAARTTMVSSVS